MKLSEIRHQAFVSASSRCRWFFLSTTLLAGLLLSHLYIEVFSFQDATLAQVHAARLQHKTLEKLELEADYLKNLPEAAFEQKEALDRARTYSQSRYSVDKTDNTLSNTHIGFRELPFVGFLVPANDFVPLMSIFLSIFCMGLWLSIRTLYAIIMEQASCDSTDPEGEVSLVQFKYHFTFTGLQDPNGQSRVAKFVQYLTLWMPALAIVAAIPMDFLPPIFAHIDDQTVYIGSLKDNVARAGVMISCLIAIVASAAFSTDLVRQCDREMNKGL